MPQDGIARSKRDGPYGDGMRILRSPPATSLRRLGHRIKPSAKVYNRKRKVLGLAPHTGC